MSSIKKKTPPIGWSSKRGYLNLLRFKPEFLDLVLAAGLFNEKRGPECLTANRYQVANGVEDSFF